MYFVTYIIKVLYIITESCYLETFHVIVCKKNPSSDEHIGAESFTGFSRTLYFKKFLLQDT